MDTATQRDLAELDLVSLDVGGATVNIRCCLARPGEPPAGCYLRLDQEPCP